MSITTETRREAYEAVQQETAAVNRGIILMAFQRHFPNGATCHEVAQLLGWDITSVRPRMTEMSRIHRDRPAVLTVTGKRVSVGSPLKCAVYTLIGGKS